MRSETALAEFSSLWGSDGVGKTARKLGIFWPRKAHLIGLQRDVGGAAGIRTLDTLLAYTHFPGERLRPLGHRSAYLTGSVALAAVAGLRNPRSSPPALLVLAAPWLASAVKAQGKIRIHQPKPGPNSPPHAGAAGI